MEPATQKLPAGQAVHWRVVHAVGAEACAGRDAFWRPLDVRGFAVLARRASSGSILNVMYLSVSRSRLAGMSEALSPYSRALASSAAVALGVGFGVKWDKRTEESSPVEVLKSSKEA